MASTQCICKKCRISVPVDLDFRGTNVKFSGCVTTVKCPKCGNPLSIPDGKYASNLYGKYLNELSQAFEESLRRIQTNHNFEHGPEFEIAICETLRLILPDKYGICRGYVVDSAGDLAGDDIIIYDRIRFPTIRLEKEEKFDRKQRIPIEAAFIYIEAKNTLFLADGGGQSLEKSVNQVADVKKLVAKRKPVKVVATRQHNYPKIRNPMMGIIIANNVKDKQGGVILPDEDIVKGLKGNGRIANGNIGPDIIVAGSNVIGLPFYKSTNNEYEMVLPFAQQDTLLVPNIAPGVAFGTMVAAILLSMEWVVLGPIPWPSVIADGLGIKSI
jgi:hypothetical protein